MTVNIVLCEIRQLALFYSEGFHELSKANTPNSHAKSTIKSELLQQQIKSNPISFTVCLDYGVDFMNSKNEIRSFQTQIHI